MSVVVAPEDAVSAPALPWPALLPWQHATLTGLARNRADVPHALLFYGPRGIGKHALALNLARALLCESPRGDGTACDACAGCRYAIAGQHPDLLRLELMTLDEETGELGMTETIPIERVRALIEFTQLTSHRQGVKVAVIAPAERMNTNAANALLKTLEEPPPGTYLLLVAEQPGRLPATILSRCRKLAAPRPDATAARKWLAAQGVRSPELLLAQAGGAPLAALALSDANLQLERQAWLSALTRPEIIPVLQLAARIEAGGREQRRARLAHGIDWLLGWTGDLARVAAGAKPQRNPDFGDPLAVLASRVAPLPLFRYHRALLRQRAQLAHPLQPRLVAESLLLDYCALFTQVSPS